MGDETYTDMGMAQPDGPSTVQHETDEPDDTNRLNKQKLATGYLLMNLKMNKTSKNTVLAPVRGKMGKHI